MKRFLLSVMIAGLIPLTGCHYRTRYHACGQVAGRVSCSATGCAVTGPATIEAPAAVPYDPQPVVVPEAPLPAIRPAPVTEPGEAPKETIPEPAPKTPADAPAPAAEPDGLKGPDGAEAAEATSFREIPEIETEATERVSGSALGAPLAVEE